MDKVFSHLMGKCVEVYVHDMVVESPSHQHHAQDLSTVFSALRQYNLKLNPEKCVFGVDRGKFLGFMLTQYCYHRNAKPQQYQRSPAPDRPLNCHLQILTKTSRTTQPIIQLLKKFAKFSWNDECGQVFQNLKTTLTSPPILHKLDIH